MVVFLGKLIKKAKKAAGGLVKSPVTRGVARVAVPVAGVSLAVLLARRRSRPQPEATGGVVKDRSHNDKKSR